MKKYFLFSITIIFLFSCTEVKNQIIAKVKLRQIKMDEIYDKDKVSDMIFDAEEMKIDSIKKVSRKLFLQGIEAYKNKKNALGAIPLFQQSIVTFPDAKTYYELGNALLDSKQEKVNIQFANKAFEIAEHLNFQPKSMLYYKMACVQNETVNSDIRWDVIQNLWQAFNNGFNDTALIGNDEHLKSIINTNEYKTLITNWLASKSKKNTNGLYNVFVKSFNTTSLPFEISLENVEMKDYHQSISYDFAQFIPEMENTSFGRDVSNEYFYVTKLPSTDKYTAIIYSSVSYYGENMQPIYTKLSTYDNNGNIISTKLIAGQFSAEKVKKCRIENNLIFIEDYKRIWKKPIDKVPFEENEIDKYELLVKAQYKIEENGKIEEESVPANYNDSSSIVKQ